MALSEIDLASASDETVLQAIRSLVEMEESRALEFKYQLNFSTVEQKTDFLINVASFANASGGYLVYGIEANDSVATNLKGFDFENTTDADNLDDLTLKIQNTLNDGIKPKVPGVIPRAVPLEDGTICLVIGIPNSYSSPHMVDFRGTTKFYTRQSKGKVQLDVQGIRTAFELSGRTADRIEDFRARRLSNLISDDTPVPMIRGTQVLLHWVPVGALETKGKSFNTEDQDFFYARIHDLGQTSSGLLSRHINFDGMLIHEETNSFDRSGFYTQIFRDGRIELCQTKLSRANIHDKDSDFIHLDGIERVIFYAFQKFISISKRIGRLPPVLLLLSLNNVEGVKARSGDNAQDRRSRAIQRNTLTFPEVTVPNFSDPPSKVLRPLFDILWNATGFNQSPNFDQNGKWTPPY